MVDTSLDSRDEIERIAEDHSVPPDAVVALLEALRRGGGRQAQFSHPALGGMGQWSRGGGIMIGDMFNHSLKAKVERLCDLLAVHVGEKGPGNSESATRDWWPRELGRPSSVGSQNGHGYACFPDKRRLAIRGDDGLVIYDTGDHRIDGVSQQQGGGRDLVFSSQHGRVRLSDFTTVRDDSRADHGADARFPDVQPQANEAGAMANLTSENTRHSEDVLVLIERLHELQRRDILTTEEFAAKKTELLARL